VQIDIISCVPELLESPFSHSILKRAQKRKLLKLNIHDLRKYGLGNTNQIDDYAYGGGAGMVLMAEPLSNCIEKICENQKIDEIIYLSPDGDKLDQKTCNLLSLKSNIILISGHYKGIDERIREKFVTREISIGDYVLSGGELPVAVLVDAVARLLPGVLNDETSALSDSFQDNLLAPPVYTRPSEFKGLKVPDVLLSGHDAKIEQWRYEQSLKRTRERRPDLLD
jgi:tRNA (guanine37-N1)-methyltransferase